ncbi:thioredoxin-dependent thiol peroxidase [Falsochrobactrum shanghaiense]|uniref:thioredoxin-dependent peroxiredoxin n=1 Tax=Falsochrobactrum shanghaiense TaxID=2201899 RepID=A0A316JSL3_9HYPH|nr:thioredoxin-dependent thiol peroxidase [Falsochrobactrum shanghaiense]PWL18250.1 thioredoxin-dependent thiol peroxidase [Falsochrobactrum shanghaiense]
MARPQPGDMAPDFTLPSDNNATISLSSMKGKAVVLYFYPKDDTSGCTREALDFSQLKPEFDGIDTMVIGVSPDSVEKHAKFRKKHGLLVELAADEDKAILESFGVWVEKSMYGRKYMGVERTTFLIDAEGRIAQVWNKVKVAGHAQAVLESARALQS